MPTNDGSLSDLFGIVSILALVAARAGALKLSISMGAGLIRCWRFLPNQRRKALSDQLDVGFWHFSDIPPAPTNVRYRG
jgi:hypothetical protein